MSGLVKNLSTEEIGNVSLSCKSELDSLGGVIDVERCLVSLAKLGEIWIDLNKKYDPENEIEDGYIDEFTELYRLFPDFFKSGELEKYFCSHYKSIIKSLSSATTFNRFEEVYDEALSFSSVLIGMLEVEGGSILTETVRSQKDFNTWKDYLVLASREQEE